MAKGTKQRNATHYQQVTLWASSLINSDFHWIYASWLTEPSNKSQQWTHPHITYSPTTITSVPSFLHTAGLPSPLQHPYALSTLSSPTPIFQQLCLACWWAKANQDLCRDQGYTNPAWQAKTYMLVAQLVGQESNTFPQPNPPRCCSCPVNKFCPTSLLEGEDRT